MNTDSQSEDIWRYAMRPTLALGDTRNEPLNPRNDASGSCGGGAVTTTDLSGEFGSLPTQFNFHGLVPTQSQSQRPLLMAEKTTPQPVVGTESQKENLQLSLASGSRTPPLSSPASNLDTRKTIVGLSSNKNHQSSHVTGHVTGASSAREHSALPHTDATNAPSFALEPTPFVQDHELAPRATPLRLNNNKLVLLPSRTAPQSSTPPGVSRVKSMPPRLNRYAPRNVHPSSQDSFAGPPVAQNLNEFARNSRILNNTFIRRSETGGVEAVFHRQSHFSSTSLSEPGANEPMSISESDLPEATTASQIIRAAFDPSLSPGPVVLAKDSQSERHSQDSDRAPESDRAQGPDRPQDLSSSCGSFQFLDRDVDLVATQPDSQSPQQNDQHNTGFTPPIPPPGAPLPPSAGSTPVGPSPLPVPPHRRWQIAALEAARLRARDEVVPETPQSTLAPMIQTSAPRESPLEQGKDILLETKGSQISKSASRRGDVIEMDEETLGARSSAARPVSKQSLKPHAQAEASLARVTEYKGGETLEPLECAQAKQPPIIHGYGPADGEVVPDSQEEEQQGSERAEPVFKEHQPEGEVIPDSQEDHQENVTTASSPPIPLRNLLPRPIISEEAPGPLSTTTMPLLCTDQVPEGVTYNRRRFKENKEKGKGKGRAVESDDEVDSPLEIDCTPPAGTDAQPMAVDKEHSLQDVLPSLPAHKSKRGPVRSPQKKRTPTSSRNSKKRSNKITAVAGPGPSTRSKKRKNDTPAELAEDDSGVPTISAPTSKRQRKTKHPPPAPPIPLISCTRVFARRPDKGNHYLPGTVNMAMTGLATASRASTVFRVKFDDGFEDEVDVQFMRRFELENFDNVHIKWPAKHKDCAAEVVSTERWSNELVDVQELDRGPDGEDFEVSSKFISITEARIRQQFSERRISSLLLRGDLDFDIPFDIPMKNERLGGMGFVITLPDLPRGKRSLQKLIVASGGIVFEEWNSLISLEGSVELSGRRMSGATHKIRMTKDVPGLLFCLADEARTTPKYLIALALGVPCLSLRWVLERALKPDTEQKVDWPAYVLPAGHNSTTRMPASQGFSRAWWRTSGSTPNLISDPPTFKPFLDKSFLCFGTKEFLFAQNELGIFPKLLLAMGASYVEAVTDIAHINKPPAQFNYTVVDDGEPHLEYQSALSVDVWWIKKCLIAGIEGPVPWPDPE